MRTRTMLRSLALAVALALPAGASAFTWGGYAGLDYSRLDRDYPAYGSYQLTRLEYNLGLDGGGYFSSPGTMQWQAAIQWRRLAESTGNLDLTRSYLTYILRSALFQDLRSPVRMQVYATRLDEDAKTDNAPGTTQANTTTAGGDLRLVLPGRPNMSVGYQYFEREETAPLLNGFSRTLHTVTGSTSYDAGSFDYALRYTGNFSSGTFTSDSYDDHRVDLDGQADLGRGVTGRFSESWFRRVPGNEATTNLSQEFNAISAVVLGKTDAQGHQRVSYNYVHALNSAPGMLDQERAEQRLTYFNHRLFTGTPWQLYLTADAALSEIRAGSTVERAAGQLVYAQGVWRRLEGQDLLEVRGGPQLGAREPDAGDAEFGYGATLGGTAQHAWDRLLGSASYDVAYESDLYAASGWTFRQHLLTNLTAPLLGGEASAQFGASAQRRDGGLLGPGASRAFTLQATYRWRRHQLQALGGLQEGMVGAIGETVRGDGLFLPAPYDTQTRYGTVTATVGLTDYLWLTARARSSSSSLPDRADQEESELSGSITWSYAGIFLSLEDRYTTNSVGAGATEENLFIFRIRRGFGARQ